MKICKKCLVSKPNNNFGINNAMPDLKNRLCKPCLSHERKQARLNNPEVYKLQWARNKYSQPDSSENRRLLSAYGISSVMKQTYANIINNACEICKSKLPLVVDHDHKTGNFRGLLCSQCNRGLGHFKDNKKLLEKAMEYLL